MSVIKRQSPQPAEEAHSLSDEILHFLRTHNLDPLEYRESFAANEITREIHLKFLEKEDLAMLGLGVGPNAALRGTLESIEGSSLHRSRPRADAEMKKTEEQGMNVSPANQCNQITTHPNPLSLTSPIHKHISGRVERCSLAFVLDWFDTDAADRNAQVIRSIVLYAFLAGSVTWGLTLLETWAIWGMTPRSQQLTWKWHFSPIGLVIIVAFGMVAWVFTRLWMPACLKNCVDKSCSCVRYREIKLTMIKFYRRPLVNGLIFILSLIDVFWRLQSPGNAGGVQQLVVACYVLVDGVFLTYEFVLGQDGKIVCCQAEDVLDVILNGGDGTHSVPQQA